MPSNAAGPWRKFDAEDKATWPEAGVRYLVWLESNYAITAHFFNGNVWIGVKGVTHWAEILPPESSAAQEREGR